MKLVYADLSLRNPRNNSLEPLEVKALVIAGALPLCIPSYLARQLELRELYRQKVSAESWSPCVGPLEVRFANRTCFTDALVVGEIVLLGAFLLEEMDTSPLVLPSSPKKPDFYQGKNILTVTSV